MAENYQVTQGGSLGIAATLRDQFGSAITTYSGSETLTTSVWPGGYRAVSFTPTTTWATPASGTITITISAAETTGLSIGRYQLLTRVQPSGQDPVDAYGCTLDILAAPGTETTPPVYTQYSDLLRYGRSWLRQLQTDDDEAGFAEQQGRARTWLEDIAHAHYRSPSMVMVIGSQVAGPRESGARSTWLEQELAANTLMLTDQIRECVAKKALAYICEGQVGIGPQSDQYARLGRMYHSQADAMGANLILSLDTNGDGFADVNIPTACTNPLFG